MDVGVVDVLGRSGGRERYRTQRSRFGDESKPFHLSFHGGHTENAVVETIHVYICLNPQPTPM